MFTAAPSSVTSRDGTEIAYWTTGTGAPLVVVHGTPADHTRWRPLLPELEPHFTVHAVDRRGRGASGDAPGYALEREYEDVAAVIDAVAAASGRTANVYGHSHGGLVALGAATLTANVARVVLYEGWPAPEPETAALLESLADRVDALVTAGDRDGAVEVLFRTVGDMSDEDMAAFKAAPSWAGRVAAAHTIARELRAECAARLDPAVAATIAAPVLLVVGEHSVDPTTRTAGTVAAALPHATTVVLPGHGHVADVLDPAGFAARVLPFLRAGP